MGRRGGGEEEEEGKKGGAVEIGHIWGGEIVEGLCASDFCDSRENMERHRDTQPSGADYVMNP